MYKQFSSLSYFNDKKNNYVFKEGLLINIYKSRNLEFSYIIFINHLVVSEYLILLVKY